MNNIKASQAQLCVDILVPMFNEAEAAPTFHRQLLEGLLGLPYRFRVIYINDGSTDGTQAVLEDIANQISTNKVQVNVIELSRNFGHQAALTAGLDIADADYIISMDGDGQHPPAMVGEMLRLAEAGYDVVLTQRVETNPPPRFKRWTSDLFYRLINQVGDTRVIPGSADFRLLNRAALEGLRSMPEYHRFIRGMVAWMGFHTIILPFEPPARLAGKSKYSLRKMLRLARDAIFSFSLVPLYIGLSLGALLLVLAVVEMIYVLSFWLTGNVSHLSPGWSSLMFVMLVIGGILMILLGFIGMYIGFIFQEVKRRPIYLVRKSVQAGEEPILPASSKK